MEYINHEITKKHINYYLNYKGGSNNLKIVEKISHKINDIITLYEIIKQVNKEEGKLDDLKIKYPILKNIDIDELKNIVENYQKYISDLYKNKESYNSKSFRFINIGYSIDPYIEILKTEFDKIEEYSKTSNLWNTMNDQKSNNIIENITNNIYNLNILKSKLNEYDKILKKYIQDMPTPYIGLDTTIISKFRKQLKLTTQQSTLIDSKDIIPTTLKTLQSLSETVTSNFRDDLLNLLGSFNIEKVLEDESNLYTIVSPYLLPDKNITYLPEKLIPAPTGDTNVINRLDELFQIHNEQTKANPNYKEFKKELDDIKKPIEDTKLNLEALIRQNTKSDILKQFTSIEFIKFSDVNKPLNEITEISKKINYYLVEKIQKITNIY